MMESLIVGFLFGALLQRGGLARHERIVGVFLLRDLAVMQFLVCGLIAGSVTLTAARALLLAGAAPVVPTHLLANAVGGGLFGIGMAVAGFCPGTIAAAAGTGRLDALVPGAAGLFAGALLYGAARPSLPAWLADTGALGPATIPGLLGVSPWLVILLLCELAAIGFYAAARHARG